jgi:hypothetical protein
VTIKYIIYTITFTYPQNIYATTCECIWQYLHYPCVNVNVKENYAWQEYKCKCKKFKHVSVNDLHIHEIYMPYIQLFKLIRTKFALTPSSRFIFQTSNNLNVMKPKMTI